MRRIVVIVAGLLVAVAACSTRGAERPVHGTSQTTAGSGMRLTSTAFERNGAIPERYTCDGANVSPSLSISDPPAGVMSFAVVMDDPDAPAGVWDHWIAYDIPGDLIDIPEAVGSLGTPGTNSFGRTGYGGPCPPGGSTHRYFFTIYALDTTLGLESQSDKARVLDAISGHVLAEATLVGTYGR